jgi:hypothetical protein
MLGEGRASTPCFLQEEGVDGTPSRAMTELWGAAQFFSSRFSRRHHAQVIV